LICLATHVETGVMMNRMTTIAVNVAAPSCPHRK
jgi:hypothetical protein